MKRILIVAVLMLTALSQMAQDIKKTKDFITAKDWAKAKESIDKTMENPKSAKNPEAFYLKAKVYSNLGNDEARVQSFDAIKKAIELDKTQTMLFLAMDNYAPVFNLYTTSFDQGAKAYNEEKYADALQSFKNTLNYGEYIFQQGWGLFKLDTLVTYYSALAAMNAKNTDDAIKYFSVLADSSVHTLPEHATAYRYLAKHFYDKKDGDKMHKYINSGLKFYPKDDYLPFLELDFVRDGGDRNALMKKYQELLTANPENFDVIIEYANEIFSDTHVSEAAKRPANYLENVAKIEKLYNQALALQPENLDVFLSLGKHYYNQALLIEEDIRSIKGTKPEDIKKKNDLNTRIIELCDKSIVPLDKAFTGYSAMKTLKTRDKSNFKSTCSLLNYAYEKKKDKARADMYQKKYDEL